MHFYGRSYELKDLNEEFQRGRSSLTILYGRRRIGKTSLLQEFCKGKNHLRFEGLETGKEEIQIHHFLKELSRQTGRAWLGKIQRSTWREALDTLSSELSGKKKQILVFDEFPWMIQKNKEVVSLFKYFWDNDWARKENLMVVFCGSVNSFMVNDLMHSSAFYGRINKEICLGPLSLENIGLFFSKNSFQDILEFTMIFGGIPKYLEEINPKESLIQNVNRLCFKKDAYFVGEFERIFKDEFDIINVYEKIVSLLSSCSSMNYSEILRALHAEKGGGYLDYLKNLELAGFIQHFSPFDRPDESRLVRYRLVDEYLLFYFHFIKPHLKKIQENQGENLFLNFIGRQRWAIWVGFAFERFCLKQSKRIQKILQIDQLVKRDGSFFNRKTTLQNGFQIDLLFERFDRVMTLCEMKYLNKPIGTEIIQEVERKVSLLPLGKTQTLERVLITLTAPTQKLEAQHYFNRIIMAEDLFRHEKIPAKKGGRTH